MPCNQAGRDDHTKLVLVLVQVQCLPDTRRWVPAGSLAESPNQKNRSTGKKQACTLNVRFLCGYAISFPFITVAQGHEMLN
jgi:hypothetical protein